jgi:hypothetical protein
MKQTSLVTSVLNEAISFCNWTALCLHLSCLSRNSAKLSKFSYNTDSKLNTLIHVLMLTFSCVRVD